MTPSATIEPACPPEQRRRVEGERPIGRALVAVRRPFDAIPRASWDALADRNPWATPFSRWAFHRAWWDAYGTVAHDETLEKKHRHEIRRKIRRAAAAGQIELVESSDPLSELPAFIELHQKKWGADGLFPPTPGGERSRTFVRRMFEEFGSHGMLRLSFLSVGGRRVAAGVHFDDGHTVAYYNAGIDPDAKDLSPGVVMIAWLIKRAIELGRRRVDFLRGNEPYKYEWGAVDEPLQRILVRRTAI